MRFTAVVICVLFVVLLILGGCGSKRTVTVPGGKATVTDEGGNGKTVEMETKEGKATMSTEKKSITEAELGVAVYPGAKVEMSGSYEGSAAGQEGKSEQYMLTTPDSFEKVTEFYKANLSNVKNSFNQTMGGQKMAVYAVKGADGKEIPRNLQTKEPGLIRRCQHQTQGGGVGPALYLQALRRQPHQAGASD